MLNLDLSSYVDAFLLDFKFRLFFLMDSFLDELDFCKEWCIWISNFKQYKKDNFNFSQKCERIDKKPMAIPNFK